MSYYFQNARILMGDYEALPLQNAVVLVQDGRIAYAGYAEQAPEVPEDAEVIDVMGRIILPGLVNAHTHSAMTVFRGAADDLPLHRWLNDRIWPMEAKLDDEAVYWGSMLAIAEMIRGGVTAFNDMYFFTEQTVRAVEHTGIRALLTRCVTCNETDEASIRQGVQRAADCFAQFDGAAQGRIRVSIAPHAEYTCSAPFLRALGEKAQELGARVHIHVSETKEEHEQCKQRHGGLTPIGLLDALGVLDNPTLAAHCVYVDAQDLAIMQQKHVSVLHCPGSNLKLASGIAPVPAMLAHGLCIALGTDGAASNNNLNMFEELQAVATLHKGTSGDASMVRAAQALRMATQNGAQALGLSSGVLAAGEPADLIIVDIHKPHMMPMYNALHNIVYSAQASDVWMTMVDGKVLYHDGAYQTLDIEQILYEASRVAARLGS